MNVRSEEYDRMVCQRDILRAALQAAAEGFAEIRDGSGGASESWQQASKYAEERRLELARALAEARK
jgi:hypothetical protein